MYVATWYEIQCPGCEQTSFVDNGDTVDLTIGDIHAIICPHCQKCCDWDGNIVDDEYADEAVVMEVKKI